MVKEGRYSGSIQTTQRAESSCIPCQERRCPSAMNVVIVEEDVGGNSSCIEECCTSCVSFVHFILGALCLALVMYGVANAMFTQDWHGILFGFGYLCFLVPGILITNRFYGPAKAKTMTDRKFKHMLFEVLGLAFQIVGIAMLMKAGFKFESVESMSVHKILGIFSIITIAICSFTGVFVAKNDRWFCRLFHSITSYFAFLTSAACFTTGLIEPKFKAWSMVAFKHQWPIILVVLNSFLMIFLTLGMCFNWGKGSVITIMCSGVLAFSKDNNTVAGCMKVLWAISLSDSFLYAFRCYKDTSGRDMPTCYRCDRSLDSKAVCDYILGSYSVLY